MRVLATVCGALAALLIFSAGARADFGYVGAIGETAPFEFFYPSDVATDPDGNLYVADTLNNRIATFAPNGAALAQWPVSGPTGVTVAGGTVYVASGDAVMRFTPAGASAGPTLTVPGDQVEQVAVDSGGDVYATLLYSGKVAKLTGATWRWTVPAGTAHGIAIGPDNNVYVAELKLGAPTARIDVVSRGGASVRWFNVDASAFGDTTVWPWDIAFGDGSAWITDNEGDCFTGCKEGILRIDPATGSVLGMWGTTGNVGDMFNEAMGIAYSSGAVYVADHTSSRVVRWGAPVAGGWPVRASAGAPPASGGGDPAAVGGGDSQTTTPPPTDVTPVVAKKLVAKFVVTTRRPRAKRPVVFDAGSSRAGNSRIASYSWAFGDRKSAKGRKVSHVYKKRGTFKVTLTLRDAQRHTAKVTRVVKVAG